MTEIFQPATEATLIEALRSRWPADQFVLITQAPDATIDARSRLDLLVIGLWRSRGHQLDGVEVKVSWADWVRERKASHKADWWWRHTHRYWIAAPTELAKRIASDPERPESWGVLSVGGNGVRVVVTPEHRVAEPVPWNVVCALLRRAGNIGPNELTRRYEAGRAAGYTAGAEHGRSLSVDGGTLRQLTELRESVARFEKASGIAIGDWNSTRYGQLTADYLAERNTGGVVSERLDGSADNLSRLSQEMHQVARNLRNAVAQAQRTVSPELVMDDGA